MFFLSILGAGRAFAAESTLYVLKIADYPGRPNAVQVFLGENGGAQWEKRLDLFGEGVQQVLKDNIKENGAVVYETEGLRADYFVSNRLIAIILPDGNKVEVLDLFPHFNETTLNFSFPYALAKRKREQVAANAPQTR